MKNHPNAIFFDRDGTLIEEVGYLHRPDQVVFISDAIPAMQMLQSAGYFLIIISNQSGVARGYYTENDILNVHQYMDQFLRKEGIVINGFYYCPHHPDAKVEQYKIDCNCRKPATGMIRQAETDLKINLNGSFMIGDKISDVQCALNAGINPILVLTGYGNEELALLRSDPNMKCTPVVKSIGEASELIVKYRAI